MQLEPWVCLCVLFAWWFKPRELLGVWLVDIVLLPRWLQTFSSFSPSPNPSIWVPIIRPMVAWELLDLYSSVSGRASQETAISGCQQALLCINNSVWVWCLYMGRIPRRGISGWPFLYSLFHSLSVYFL